MLRSLGADRRLERFVRNERVDEAAIQGLRDPPKRRQLDTSLLFGPLEVNDAGLPDARPLCELSRAHTEASRIAFIQPLAGHGIVQLTRTA